MKGSKFLKVTGILMIIGGALGILGVILLFVGVGALTIAGGTDVGATVTFLVIASIFGSLAAIIELIAGIVGVKNYDKPEKAKTCLVWGIIVIVLSLIGNVVTLANMPENFSVLSLITGLILPVLYVIGAIKNKPEAQVQAAE